MKQSSFLLGAAVLMLATACSNDEVVNVAPQTGAIGFNSFVNKSTRATVKDDYTLDNLKDLKVWGVTSGNAGTSTIFNAELVDKENGATNVGDTWKYHSATRYWIIGNNYKFAALAPAKATDNGVTAAVINEEDGLTFTFDNKVAKAELDLLYASDAKTSVTAAVLDKGVVELDFAHMLSKVQFQFDNKLTNDNFAFSISNLKITNATSTATFAEGADKAIEWTVAEGNENYSVSFKVDENAVHKANTANDAEKSEHMYLIPLKAGNEYTITFDITLYNKDMKENSYAAVKTYPREVKVASNVYKNNYSYLFKAEITEKNISGSEDDLLPITFDVTSVEDWKDATPDTELPGFVANND